MNLENYISFFRYEPVMRSYISGKTHCLPVPRGVEDKCGDNILIEIKPIEAFLGKKRFLPFYIKLSKEEKHA